MLSVVLAVLAAAANASSSVLQRKANMAEPDEVAFHRQLLLDLLRRPVWLAGIIAVIVGFLLQAAALSHGQLALVEPILVVELPFTLLLASAVFHRSSRPRDWWAVAAMSVGLALLVVSLSPTGGSVRHVPTVHWALGAGVSLGVVASLLSVAWRARRTARAALLGVATGVMFGFTAALMTAMSAAFARGVGNVFTTWQTYAMAVTGISAMVLLQNALQSGTLVAVQPGLTLSDPVVSVAWGAAVLHEHLRAGPWLIGALAGAALIVSGTLLISRSGLIEDRHAGGQAPVADNG